MIPFAQARLLDGQKYLPGVWSSLAIMQSLVVQKWLHCVQVYVHNVI